MTTTDTVQIAEPGRYRHIATRASVRAMLFDGSGGSALSIVEWLGDHAFCHYDLNERRLTLRLNDPRADATTTIPANTYVIACDETWLRTTCQAEYFPGRYEAIS